jgi:predicted amino acid dehydrogenase
MNNDQYGDVKPKKWKGKFPQLLEEPAKGSIKVGFISNFTNPASELKVIEPDLESASETGLRILFNKLQVLLDSKPIKIMQKNLLGGKVHFTFYLLPFDTAHLESVSRWGKKHSYIFKIQDAVNKLAEEGVTHVSLGAHASIITNNGLSLAPKNGIKIITGNTLTISSCLYHLDQYIQTIKKQEAKTIKIAVVGASGNIGSGITKCLFQEKYKGCQFIFIGNNLKRLQKLDEEDDNKGLKINCTTDLFSLKDVDVVICCTNTNDPIIFPHHLPTKHIVYAIDISIPQALSEEAMKMDNVIVCKKASSITLTQDPDLQISAHTAEGKIFCCAAEAILDGLYQTDFSLKGHIEQEAVKVFYKLGEAEHFFK